MNQTLIGSAGGAIISVGALPAVLGCLAITGSAIKAKSTALQLNSTNFLLLNSRLI